MIIKKYNDFILERLGVPDNIVDSATKLYELIISELSNINNDNLADLVKAQGDNEVELDLNLPIKIKIADLEFSTVEFNISIHVESRFQVVDVLSWGVGVMPTSEDEYKILHDKSLRDNIDLRAIFIANDNNYISDIVDYLTKERVKTIGILSHELKHVYDKYVIGYQILSDVVDYQTFASVRTGFNEIDKFIYYIYVVSKAENLVRPAEIAGQIESAGITKSEFSEFIQDNRLYKELHKIKNWKYEDLKKDLFNNISEVRKRFGDIPEGESDEDVIDVTLNSTYRDIVEHSGKTMQGILGLDNAIRILTGNIKESDIDYFNKYIGKKIFNNYDDFFLFWEKKLNFEGERMIKKIIKLYDMCKDEVVNPLMAKINDRVNGQCIVNPKLYNEVVLKSKSGKKTYTKN